MGHNACIYDSIVAYGLNDRGVSECLKHKRQDQE